MSNLEPRQNPGMKPGAREEKTVPASYKTYRFALLLSIFKNFNPIKMDRLFIL